MRLFAPANNAHVYQHPPHTVPPAHTSRLVQENAALKAEVEELRADYTTQQADFMKAGKQSEIIKRVESMGIEENKTPPTKIIVKDW